MRNTRIIVTHYGGPDSLRVVEEDCPEPKPGEVRVSVLAAGVSLPDVMAREGIHPETPPVPFTPGWDLVGVVDRLGDGVSGIEPGQIVAAMPISGAYTQFVCLPQCELVPVPSGLDAAEAVSLVLNYIPAFVPPKPTSSIPVSWAAYCLRRPDQDHQTCLITGLSLRTSVSLGGRCRSSARTLQAVRSDL
jgi:NADPH:quinone reductase-like Zn-dependent oxidoreductase